MQLQSNSFNSLASLSGYLSSEGCHLCSLGFQPGLNGCCVARGNPMSHRLILGEGPGETEDAQSLPFVGPAGQLLDKIMGSVELDTNQDFYLTNVVLCRPISRTKWKKNCTPLVVQQQQCRPYLDNQIALIQPKIIVTLGNTATKAMLGPDSSGITALHGTINEVDFRGSRVIVYPLIHPAALLHAKKNPEQEAEYRRMMWRDVRNLKSLIIERSL